MNILIWLVCVFLSYLISEEAIPGVDSTSPDEESLVDDMFSESVRTVAALGRVAELGDLYDARTDNFVGISLYPDGIPGDIIHSTGITHANIDYVRTESLAEIFEKLGISPSLAVSFMAGFVRVSGSAKYLDEEKESLQNAKASLIYSLRTVQEQVNITSEKSRRLIDCSLLEHIIATHVVRTYLEGELKNSFYIGNYERKIEQNYEHVLLISRLEDVLLLVGNLYAYDTYNTFVTSYDLTTAYNKPEFYFSTVALVDDTLYNVDTKNGLINSTYIGNIVKPSKDGINWKHVGSFPNETKLVESVAAVNDSVFYFVSSHGILYKFDTRLKTVTNCAQVSEREVLNSLLIVNKMLYIYAGESFYSFDGTLLKKLPTPENRLRPGLFIMDQWPVDDVCCVGGDLGYKGEKLHPVYCYKPRDNRWDAHSYTNELREYPGVAETESGTIIVGGQGILSDGTTTGPLNSIEIFNRETKTWSYIASPPGMRKDYYRALSFNFYFED